EQGGSFTSQLHRNERRFDSLSGKFDVVSPETSAVGPLISISLDQRLQRALRRTPMFFAFVHSFAHSKTCSLPHTEIRRKMTR
ncbi:hypothetical protein, partial [Burkholderia vietnamiensis]|uniref:hypothetical protein n=1 Tax=Burkholderia vietnamiensis TaxID=60552 RepID=UPI001B8FAE1D